MLPPLTHNTMCPTVVVQVGEKGKEDVECGAERKAQTNTHAQQRVRAELANVCMWSILNNDRERDAR